MSGIPKYITVVIIEDSCTCAFVAAFSQNCLPNSQTYHQNDFEIDI